MRYFAAIASLLLLAACNNTGNKLTETKDSTSIKTVATVTIAPNFKDPKVADIYSKYILLKDELVNTKFAEAKTAAKSLAVALQSYSGCENTALTANKIEASTGIAAQRVAFTALSTDVIALFKHADFDKGAIYVQHCPMANKGDGGDWLSSQKEIRNPYYGDQMMECGAVVEVINAK
ncbi:MAG: DUF3347 domain-containing protein [Bacteroidota bacterium]